ncbi:Lactoylglutathione lyase and related lyases, partial [hydrothermal vent metagenome]
GFYDTLLVELGAKRTMEGDGFIAWGGEDGATSFCITKPFDGNPATVGNGTMMALYAPNHEMVDKIHALALELGATCEGPVGPRPEYDKNFYAGYFRDLEGNKLNVFNFPLP